MCFKSRPLNLVEVSGKVCLWIDNGRSAHVGWGEVLLKNYVGILLFPCNEHFYQNLVLIAHCRCQPETDVYRRMRKQTQTVSKLSLPFSFFGVPQSQVVSYNVKSSPACLCSNWSFLLVLKDLCINFDIFAGENQSNLHICSCYSPDHYTLGKQWLCYNSPSSRLQLRRTNELVVIASIVSNVNSECLLICTQCIFCVLHLEDLLRVPTFLQPICLRFFGQVLPLKKQ